MTTPALAARNLLWTGLVSLLPLLASAPDASAQTVNMKVGIGTQAPAELLHVFGNTDAGSDDTVRVQVENASANVRNRRLLEMRNKGPVTARYVNTAPGGVIWNLNALVGGFVVSVAGSGANELRLEPDGDLIIRGQLTELSSRGQKKDLAPVDHRQVLDRVVALPLTTWSYSSDRNRARHLGPMAEDFRAAFHLGADDRHITPSDKAGVALAAIQGLYELLQEKDAEIAELRRRLDRMEGAPR